MRPTVFSSRFCLGTIRFAWTIALGLLVVTAVLPVNGLALAGWAATVVRSLRRSRPNVELAMHIAVMVAIVGAAGIYRPVKVTERVLDRPVVLPKTVMSLAELRTWTETSESRSHLPIRTWFAVPESDAARVVQWPRRTLSLREFVSSIEVQTSLRHRFHGCGNGWTVLWGNDCAFGLAMRDHRELYPN